MTDHEDIIVPAKFPTIIRDFARDLTATFPEYSILWKKWATEEPNQREIERLFKYCTEVYPERFFDILYQNDDIFGEDSEVNTRFLPAVEFKLLYHCAGVTETTRCAIWKYLQLILMTILNSVRDKTAFGDAANMFEGVNESELQGKLNQTLEEIGSFFKGLGGEDAQTQSTGQDQDQRKRPGPPPEFPNMEDFVKQFASDGSGAIPGMDGFRAMFEQMHTDASGGADMPNANDLHEHLKGLFDGKIGSLAKELAEEISQDVEHLFDDEGGPPKDIRSTGDLIKNIVKNPKKVMGLMKTISGKLQQKMKSGEISEEEIMKEAGDIMGKMKGMKGMGQMNEMFKNLAKGMGKGGVNTGAIQKMQRQMAMKERMLAKMEQKKEAAEKHIEKTADPARSVFRLDGVEKQEYSVAVQDAAAPPALNDDELAAMFQDNKKSGKKSSDPSNKKKKAKK